MIIGEGKNKDMEREEVRREGERINGDGGKRMRRGEWKKKMGRMKTKEKNEGKKAKREKMRVMKKRLRNRGMIEKEWKIRSMKCGKGRKGYFYK
jgi:hypothetical protein